MVYGWTGTGRPPKGAAAGGFRQGGNPVALSRPGLRNRLYPFSPGATHMAKFANILETVGNTPVVKVGKLAPAGIDLYVKIEAFNPLGLGQGPARARRDRGRRAAGDPQAGPDRHRGHQRQYRHRPRHGVRPEGLSAGRHHGGVVQRGAPKADALPRRQGGPHARAGRGDRDGEQGRRAGQDARLVPHPAVRERGQRRFPLPDHRARDRQRFRRRAAGLLGHRVRHRRNAQGRRPGAGEGAAGDPDRAGRAGGRADRQQRNAAAAEPRRLAVGAAPGLEAASDSGLESRTSSPSSRATRSRRSRCIG